MPMPGWLNTAMTVGAGLLGFGGQERTNAANTRMAREQMAFQERMSSTSAQRAVEDYKKAGLNPGLAYDRGASSPGGASTTIGDSINSGVNSAQSARRLASELKIAQEQSEQDLRNKRVTEEVGRRQGRLIELQQQTQELANREADRLFNFNKRMEPWEQRQRSATAILTELGIPGARNEANFQSNMGQWAPIISQLPSIVGSAAGLTNIIKNLKPQKVAPKGGLTINNWQRK